jgi:hypothetical protein
MKWAIALGIVSLGYLGFSYYMDAQVYYKHKANCDQFRHKDHKAFMLCWRAKRNATHQMRKRYGDLPR